MKGLTFALEVSCVLLILHLVILACNLPCDRWSCIGHSCDIRASYCKKENVKICSRKLGCTNVCTICQSSYTRWCTAFSKHLHTGQYGSWSKTTNCFNKLANLVRLRTSLNCLQTLKYCYCISRNAYTCTSGTLPLYYRSEAIVLHEKCCFNPCPWRPTYKLYRGRSWVCQATNSRIKVNYHFLAATFAQFFI